MPYLFSQFSSQVGENFAQVLKEPEKLIQQGEILKNDKSTTVAKINWHGKSYIIKRFNARNLGHKLKRALRETRAKCCWEMSYEFSKVGIRVAEPVAMLEIQYGFFKADSYFISEFIEGDELLTWLPRQNKVTISQVNEQLHNLFDKFYGNRLSHGDMKATNLLWSQGEIFLIDLDVARKHFFQIIFKRANDRDKRRFSRNGDFFRAILHSENTD
jgi:tRNA A-37 threonylcarbamoyl transferase component Bud32